MADDITVKSQLAVAEFQSVGGQDTQQDGCVSAEFLTSDGLTANFFMVVDGMGRNGAGERAAFLACDIIPSHLLGRLPASGEISATLVQAFELANERIYQEASETPQRAGMGAACTAVVIVGLSLILVHVGDCRAYLLRAGKLHQLSFDHSWAEKALRIGSTVEELRNHPNHGEIDRYLGIGPTVEMDKHYRPIGAAERNQQVDSAREPLPLQPGDHIMLCTDGVSDVLDEKQMHECLLHSSVHSTAQTLVERAQQAARKIGQVDNLSAMVLTLPQEPPPPRIPRTPVSGKLVGTLVAVTLLAAFAVRSDALGLWTRPEKTLVLNSTMMSTAAITATQESRTAVPTAAQEARRPQQVAVSTSQPQEKASATPKNTASNTTAPTATRISTGTATPSAVATNTLTTVATQTARQTPSVTRTSSPTATLEPTQPGDTPRPATLAPASSATPVPTNTPRPTHTDTPRPTLTNTPVPTNTPRPTHTDTPWPTPTDTLAPTHVPTPLPTVIEGTPTHQRVK
ncbi:MAG: PP2C family protein-serine/threonine phosphatase [Anaerolineae bacterium]